MMSPIQAYSQAHSKSQKISEILTRVDGHITSKVFIFDRNTREQASTLDVSNS